MLTEEQLKQYAKASQPSASQIDTFYNDHATKHQRLRKSEIRFLSIVHNISLEEASMLTKAQIRTTPVIGSEKYYLAETDQKFIILSQALVKNTETGKMELKQNLNTSNRVNTGARGSHNTKSRKLEQKYARLLLGEKNTQKTYPNAKLELIPELCVVAYKQLSFEDKIDYINDKITALQAQNASNKGDI